MTAIYEIFCRHTVVTTDTRDCPKGSLFFALRGTSFNGNAFARTALEQGCAYAIIDDPQYADENDPRFILVEDVLVTLQELAHYHREQLATPIIQITGTNGKTTTKELVAVVLSQVHNVLYTQGNLNNHIGVPKTLLRLSKEHDIAVIETGANHPGEIELLSKITDPDCGLITNVGKAHLEGFGSFEGVIRTKGELYEYLRQKPKGFIFLHGDNPYLCNIAKGLEKICYGAPGENEYAVEGETLECNPFLTLRWRIKGKEWNIVKTHLIGSYNVDNALAAVTIGLHFGVSPEQINRALSDYIPSNNRSEMKETGKNHLVIDAYNANPTSMMAALKNFRDIRADHKMMILGEMRELGEASAEEHQRITDFLPETGCKKIWLVGENFRKACHPYCFFPDIDAIKEQLKKEPIEGYLILIKGSNGTKLFQLPDYL